MNIPQMELIEELIQNVPQSVQAFWPRKKLSVNWLSI